MRLDSWVLDCSSNGMQEIFTARKLGTYMEGPIWTRQETPALTTLMGSFQVRLAFAAL